MLKYLYMIVSAYLILLTGSGNDGMMMEFHSQEDATAPTAFVSGMGCSDPYCTDISHHHDCPQDCEDYNHYHNCSLDCAETGHHHGLMTDANGSFVCGMGCSDPYCTDITHHHDCPQDCGDYNHYHNCDLDCTEAEHCHRGTSGGNESGQHHGGQHHGNHHP